MPTSIYDVALELARANGWRNVTSKPLIKLARQRGLIPEGTADENWRKNLRGSNSMSQLRSRLRLEPGIPDGTPQGEHTPAWKDANRQVILDTAYKLAVDSNQIVIPRKRVAEEAGVSVGLIYVHWGEMANLRTAVAEKAKSDGRQNLVLQAQAIGLTV